ncbi:MAG: hypothetical protein GF408_06410 [Candidatus Omnitrophica bacterium]|nr:hypothetical protein [Candidatus Omnitrophota bacterium]
MKKIELRCERSELDPVLSRLSGAGVKRMLVLDFGEIPEIWFDVRIEAYVTGEELPRITSDFERMFGKGIKMLDLEVMSVEECYISGGESLSKTKRRRVSCAVSGKRSF